MRQVFRLSLLVIHAFLFAGCAGGEADFEETDIATLHDRMQRGELSSEALVAWHLQRIRQLDMNGPSLNSIVEVNPDATAIARALDAEWQNSGPRGPLHGIPIVVKANIDTADRMKTTAGSLALAEHRPAEDAFLISRLRDAGAVVIGKANLSEWANYRSSRSSSGWSSLGGQTRNPYDIRRNPCGSSSGSAVAVAASLSVAAVGTETDGSVVCPAGMNGIVGIKPTVGLISRSGIIPIAHSQDTAGPMARSVRDAAILLTAMTGKDPDDPASAVSPAAVPDYTANLAADGLQDRRIGVIRSYYGAGSHPDVEAILDAAIEAMREAGATIVDDIDINMSGAFKAEGEVLAYEFKAGVEAYLQQSDAPLRSLTEIITFNEANREAVMPIFGQELMLAADEKGPLTDPAYLEALASARRITRTGIDSALEEHELDALIAPTNGPAWLTDHVNGDHFQISSSSYAAISGYPNITVPAGFVSGLPIGLSFIGAAFTEQRLIELAYAFEQATDVRRPPEL